MMADETKSSGDHGKGVGSTPLRVVVTGAAGNIAYALSFMIAQGAMFGRDRKVRGCTDSFHPSRAGARVPLCFATLLRTSYGATQVPPVVST